MSYFTCSSKTSTMRRGASRSLTSLSSSVTRMVPTGAGGSFRMTTSGSGWACAYTAGGRYLTAGNFFLPSWRQLCIRRGFFSGSGWRLFVWCRLFLLRCTDIHEMLLDDLFLKRCQFRFHPGWHEGRERGPAPGQGQREQGVEPVWEVLWRFLPGLWPSGKPHIQLREGSPSYVRHLTFAHCYRDAHPGRRL